MKNIITWFSTYQEKMKSVRCGFTGILKQPACGEHDGKEDWHTLIARIVERN